MKVIIAPDAFKGSISSKDIIDIASQQFYKHFEQAEIIGIPIADGGEGTVDALCDQYVNVDVTGPDWKKIKATYGVFADTAVIEMANCSGLPLVDGDSRNPLFTTSFGLGQMIKRVLDDGFKKVLIGIGGSATNDGGTGALEALGVTFSDIHHNLLTKMCGSKLKDIEYIDISGLDQRLASCDIKVMCDVDNPLTGPNGATYVYGKQKGGTPSILKSLEEGMVHYAEIMSSFFEKPIHLIPGSGAAGGMGAALTAFLNASLLSGIDLVLELKSFEKHLKETDIIITGEGRVDDQSLNGKVIHGILKRAGNVPVIVVTGGVGEGYEKLYEAGIHSIITLPNKPMTLDQAMTSSHALMEEAMFNLCRLIKI